MGPSLPFSDRLTSTRSPSVSLFGRTSFSTHDSNNNNNVTAVKPHTDNTISTAQYITAFSELSKLRLSALVVSTTSAGFLAAGGPISYSTLVACCIGTSLCSSSASTFNQVLEVERDTKMKRTRNRPLPKNVYTPLQATVLGATTGVSGGMLLLYGTDCVTATLGVANIGLYAGLYTYMKPRYELNTWVGAVVGAIPPIMGWTAAGGSVTDIEALLLGSTLFLWQFPHFFALSWMHRIDYGRGGFQMVPVNDLETGDRTAKLITRYTWYLSSIPFLSTMADVTSSMFAVEGVALNAYALHVAYKFDQDRTNANARKVFLTSLWYLPCLMTLFILHSKTWKEEDTQEYGDDTLRSLLKQKINFITQTGKELCVHEAVTGAASSNQENNADRCPIVLGKTKANSATVTGATSIVASVTAVSSTEKND